MASETPPTSVAIIVFPLERASNIATGSPSAKLGLTKIFGIKLRMIYSHEKMKIKLLHSLHKITAPTRLRVCTWMNDLL